MAYPVDELLPRLSNTFDDHYNIVLQAPPGAGKSTRVPLALLNASWLGDKKIIMLEPRRIAARSTAHFMATTLGEKVGETVGYHVRMDHRCGPDTRIEVVTEGILTRMLQSDPALEDTGIVIFDEFHERSLNSDLGLALCLDAQQGLREDLRLLVMSATLDGEAVADLMGNAPVLSSEGRSYPVDIIHRAIDANFSRERFRFLDQVTQQILHALKNQQGSMLVFLPGAGEIRNVQNLLQDAALNEDIIIAPLFGQLSTQDQDRAIKPAPQGKRKIVLATAIAETSLTIEGIRIVIDSGLSRTPRFDPNSGMTSLITRNVSQAGADQRAGRAGRLEAGTCYRLWSESQHLLAFANPEIMDADLAPLVLELAQWGVSNTQDLQWLTPPPTAHVEQARDLLKQLGALDHQGRITDHGKAMVKLGAHPRLAHMILRAKELGLGDIACDIAALLEERDILKGRVDDSNLQTRLQLLRSNTHKGQIDRAVLHRVKDAATRWRKQSNIASASSDVSTAGSVLALAYPDRIALLRDKSSGRYLLSNGKGALLREGDMLSGEQLLVAAHLDGNKDARIFLAAPVSKQELVEQHSHLIEEADFTRWDNRSESVESKQQKRIGAVVLEEQASAGINNENISAALINGIRSKGIETLPWNDNSRYLQQRLGFMHQYEPEDWPDVSDTTLLDTMEQWLTPYIDGMSRLTHLNKLDLHSILLATLSWEKQQALDELAPTHITVPSGSRKRIDYSTNPPVLAVRLQEMFGLQDTPMIANQRVALLIHLLSPAQRPMQITQDLAGFWANSYHAVKKDMKGRYPKHYWPDDPMIAEPTARAKPRKK